jgi:hypothetical protein
MSKKPIYPEDLPPEPRGPAAKPGAPGHDDWLLDEALAETFPASDPTTPTRPGSSVAKRNHYRKSAP